ncbi:MAG: hypothetical protein EBQ80_03550 [Proteobacteria bacterium]|nr:hypothetical protein [Pseudomonadota bacterium]
MAESATTVSLHKPASRSLAVERLIWALKPLGLLVLLLWIGYPATADRPDHSRVALLAFLFGAAYGLVIHGPTLKKYIVLPQTGTRQRTNRVPEDYYWGHVEQTLFDNR